MKGRVLIIAGSDPSGGAGVQADIKTVTALGGYAAACITALTVQNTKGVSAVHPVAPDIIAAQVEAVMSDIGADAIKIGMIGEKDAAEKIAAILFDYARDIPIVLDPVLIATSGDGLAGEGVAGVILKKLAPLAALITPNTDEAAALTGIAVCDKETMIAAGEVLVAKGAAAALVKGGHLPGDEVVDVLLGAGSTKTFRHSRINTTSTHGTGCTLASGVATGFAQGLPLAAAVKRAIDYVREAIKTASGYGEGNGPLNHGITVKPF